MSSNPLPKMEASTSPQNLSLSSAAGREISEILPSPLTLRARKRISFWLASLFLLVFAMVVVGGVTRLTNSGLSMVEWKPIMGVLPPLDQQGWEEAFSKYKKYPEYQLLNKDMTLSGFKFIFYWEYSHRLLGRAIGLVFVVPFVMFLLAGYLNRAWTSRLLIGLLLGGSQGLMGWYMVKSGLVNEPHVSHYRLAAHLGLAFIILGYLLWLILDLRAEPFVKKNPKPFSGKVASLYRYSLVLSAITSLQIIYGAFVAGKKAGFGFNSFPLMHEHWIPEGLFHLSPAWINLFENNITLQFAHRWIPVILGIGLAIFWKSASSIVLSPQSRFAFRFVVGSYFAQFLLGVLTLILIVPIGLAAVHQAGAVVLFSGMILLNHSLREDARLSAKGRI